MNTVWVGFERRCYVTFDVPLVDGPLDSANWFLRHVGGEAQPASGVAAGPVVTLQFMALLGVSEIAYDPPPFDVVGAGPGGTAAAGFEWRL